MNVMTSCHLSVSPLPPPMSRSLHPTPRRLQEPSPSIPHSCPWQGQCWVSTKPRFVMFFLGLQENYLSQPTLKLQPRVWVLGNRI